METLPLHPKIVHIPLALAMLMPLISGGVALAWWRGWLPRRAWLIAALLHAVLSVSALVAMQTGEGDEDRVERVVSHKHIHEHEEAAETFLWVSIGALLLALGAAVVPDERKGLMLAAGTTALAATAAPLAMHTGQEGGALIYRHGAARAFYEGAEQPTTKEGAQAQENKNEADLDGDHDEDHDEGHDEGAH